MHRKRTWLLSGMLVVIFTLTPAFAHGPKSYLTLRYEGVVGQTTWYTCGPAAVATLLKDFYGLNVDEQKILKLSAKAMGADKDVTKGISALALKTALEQEGVPAEGYQVSLEDLHTYFDQGGLPLIVHVTKPQLHYVLAIGLLGDQLVLADPSFGRRVLPLAALETEKGFDGVVLVPQPDDAMTQAAQRVQQATLTWARRRRERLEATG